MNDEDMGLIKKSVAANIDPVKLFASGMSQAELGILTEVVIGVQEAKGRLDSIKGKDVSPSDILFTTHHHFDLSDPNITDEEREKAIEEANKLNKENRKRIEEYMGKTTQEIEQEERDQQEAFDKALEAHQNAMVKRQEQEEQKEKDRLERLKKERQEKAERKRLLKEVKRVERKERWNNSLIGRGLNKVGLEF